MLLIEFHEIDECGVFGYCMILEFHFNFMILYIY